MVNRVTGLNSGLDIESMVTKLMKAENAPVDKLKAKKTTLGWSSDLYREVNTKLASLKTQLDGMKLSGDWNQLSATTSNPTAVTAKADGTANSVSHSITVQNLASGATAFNKNSISQNVMTGSSSVNASTVIAAASNNNSFQVTYAGVSRTVTIADGTYDKTQLAAQIQSSINSSFGSGKIAVSANSSDKIEFSGSSQISVKVLSGNTGIASIGFTNAQTNRIDPSLSLSNQTQFSTSLSGSGSFNINGQTISYTSGDTLSGIMSRVNASSAGVNMSYDAETDRVTVASKDTGANAQVAMSDTTGNLLGALGLTGSNVDTTQIGTDAKLTIDGVSSTRSSNTFSAGGVTYTLNQVTSSPVSVNISQDIDSTVKKISSFVTAYNDAIDLMNKRVKEDKYRSYTPLTDDQKKDMKDTEITVWETKAKSGILRSDDMLQSALSGLRSLVSTSVGSNTSSTYNALYKIGITTKAYDSSATSDAGKLTLDETALRAALSKDPNAVIQTFSNYPDGIAQKMYTQVSTSMKQIIEKAGGAGTSTDNVSSTIGKQITELNSNITGFSVKLAKKEDYYYKMFSSMDTAIGKSNTIMNSLAKFAG
ncbi:flagellar filament capping protein FliD [Paenibacillus alba]|uniref:flagellar filament capping protein FliD n=1 Tax=Paenibacillus alba TaxID=1197127 RepID=UPI0015641550|nr:flagellar filament capping protein FliD [Paenibacillus alba]NQX70110.1 flagellar filament capping protein FliD [Paenibacillus alba]